MNDIETRHVDADLRVSFGEGLRALITGYPIVFNRQSVNLGGFREIIRPQAVERTFREKIDVRALIDHDTAKIIGRLSAGTMRLEADAHGLQTEIDPPNTTAARDIVESIGRRDVTGMSFAFRTVTDDWHMEEEMLIREVLDMRVLEVSPVTFPAYPDTEVAVGKRAEDPAWREMAERLNLAVAYRSLDRYRASHPALVAPGPTYRPALAMLEARQRQARG